jgi:hypothetical protein
MLWNSKKANMSACKLTLRIKNKDMRLYTATSVGKTPELNNIYFHWFSKLIFLVSLRVFIKSAMGNLRSAGRMRPFKLFSVALLESLKYAYFIEKST